MYLIFTNKLSDLWRNAVVRIRAVIGGLAVQAHLQELVDGGVHGAVVGPQHALDNFMLHAGKHSLKVVHSLAELKPSDLTGRPPVIKLGRGNVGVAMVTVGVPPAKKAGHHLRNLSDSSRAELPHPLTCVAPRPRLLSAHNAPGAEHRCIKGQHGMNSSSAAAGGNSSRAGLGFPECLAFTLTVTLKAKDELKASGPLLTYITEKCQPLIFQ